MSHNARLVNTDENTRQRRHASSRARRRQLLFFWCAAQARKLAITIRWVGGGSLKTPRAEERRRCSCRSIERILRFLVYRPVFVLFG